MSQKAAMYPQRESISYGTSIKYPRLSIVEEGFKSYTIMYTKICPCCGKKYTRYTNEAEYIIRFGHLVKRVCNHRAKLEHFDDYTVKNIKSLKFCSWNCKQKYIKENQLCRYLTDSFSNDPNLYVSKEEYDKQGGFDY